MIEILSKAKSVFARLFRTERFCNFYTLLMQSLFLRVVCIIELLILVWIVCQCFRIPCNLSFSTNEMTPLNKSSVVVHLVENTSESYYKVSDVKAIDDTKILTTNTFRLNPGAYNVKITYVSDVIADSKDSFANSTGDLTLTSDCHGVYFKFNKLSLRDAYTEESQTVQINSPVAIDDMKMTVSYKGGGNLEIYRIEITEITIYKYMLLLSMLLGFLLLDIILIKFLKGVFAINVEGVLCIICLVAAIPFVANFSYSGHDTSFHLSRIVCLSDELKQGNYFPAIFTTALNGYGYASPLFYGQLFLYLPAIFYSCGFSLTSVYNVYIIIFSIATCLIMYYSSLQIFKKTNVALLTAALYTLSAVRLTNIFTRSAVGEFTAQTFLPLVVLGFYNIYFAKNEEKIALKKYFPIIVGLTGIFLSHVLATLMCGLVIIGFCLFNLKETLKPTRLVALCKALILTILVNLSAIIPFVDSYSMNMVVNNRVNYIQAHGVYPVQLFNIIVDNFQARSVVNTAADEMSLTIGFSITFGLAIYIYYLIQKKSENQLFKFSRICFIITCITLFMSTRYMPYDALDFLPESVYSLLTVCQFPWRWLVFATLFGVYCTAYAIDSIGEITVKNTTPTVVFYVVVVILCINTGQIYEDQLKTSTIGEYSNNSYSYNMNIGQGEYLLSGSNKDAYNYADVIYDESAISLSNYERNGTVTSFNIQNNSASSEEVILPIIGYDNYYACDDNGTEFAISRVKYNKISIDVPTGYTGNIKIYYHFRYRWIVAIIVSVITIMFMIGYGIYRVWNNKKLKKVHE